MALIGLPPGESSMLVRRSAETRGLNQCAACAASRMRSVTALGWEIMATCDDAISTVVAPARLAMKRSVAGGMASSLLATTYHDGIVFQAGTPDGSLSAAASIGR